MSAEATTSTVDSDYPNAVLAALASAADSDHHLWWNRGTLWVAFCVIRDGYRQERIRTSLGTSDLQVARRRRDDVLQEWARCSDAKLSLRLPCPTLRRYAA